MIDVAHRLDEPNAVLRNVINMAVERELVRCTAPGFLVENCMAKAKALITMQSKLPTGFKSQAGAKNGIFRNCLAEGFGENIPGEKYNNGDGFSEEVNVGLLYEWCMSRFNVDGGYDGKGPGTRYRNTSAVGNRYNYRRWDSAIFEGVIVSIDPQIAHIQIKGRTVKPPVIDLSNASLLTSGNAVTVSIEGGPAIVKAGLNRLTYAFKDGGALIG